MIQPVSEDGGDTMNKTDETMVSVADHVVGLALVLLGTAIFFAMTIPGGRWYGYAAAGMVAVCATLFGMPLLVTGRVRQPRHH
jgi:hypothetical protein